MRVDKTPTAGKKYFQLPGLAETCIMWMDSFSQEGQGRRGGQRDTRSSLLRQRQVQMVNTHWGSGRTDIHHSDSTRDAITVPGEVPPGSQRLENRRLGSAYPTDGWRETEVRRRKTFHQS